MVNHEKQSHSFIQFWQNNLVRILFVLSLCYTLLYRLVFINVGELFPYAFELGEITYYTAFAIFASCIFYYFIVYLKENSDKKKIRQLVNMRLEQIEMMKGIIFKDIVSCSKIQDKNQEFPKSFEDLKVILAHMKLTNKPPRYLTGSQNLEVKDWYSYFECNFHLMFVQLLNLKISEINNEPGSIEVTIRLSNILMLAYVFQLMVSLACCVLAFIYLESSVVKILALVLPIIIYFIGIINFQFFKFLALN